MGEKIDGLVQDINRSAIFDLHFCEFEDLKTKQKLKSATNLVLKSLKCWLHLRGGLKWNGKAFFLAKLDEMTAARLYTDISLCKGGGVLNLKEESGFRSGNELTCYIGHLGLEVVIHSLMARGENPGEPSVGTAARAGDNAWHPGAVASCHVWCDDGYEEDLWLEQESITSCHVWYDDGYEEDLWLEQEPVASCHVWCDDGYEEDLWLEQESITSCHVWYDDGYEEDLWLEQEPITSCHVCCDDGDEEDLWLEQEPITSCRTTRRA
ncbi:hypothetical protein CYMTET_46461 [Cymbomonas tetramitiformis]|uniref:Uncharacterized protein n=1 Tax=Cymbomonas tetramitiformis TaxID=36881 RepID=A0AAE0EYN8_9CHLO|nr:hypothetical protein CYMTET_46461 [Cymbomonas tetramitiformis]